MPDHKFEPFQRVLVRTGDRDRWRPDFFQYDMGVKCPHGYRYRCVGGFHNECIPYTPEVEHMVGKSMPYEPPKPPQEYEWGQKVALPNGSVGIYIEYEEDTIRPHRVLDKGDVMPCSYADYEIRPLPDSAAH